MANLQPQISSIKEAMQINPATKAAEPYMVVTFTVGTHGPFQESFPKTGFDPSQVNQRVADFAQKLGLIAGQK